MTSRRGCRPSAAAICCRSLQESLTPTRSTPAFMPGRGRSTPAIPPRRPTCFTRRWPCGAGRRWPRSRSRTSPRARSAAWRSCGLRALECRIDAELQLGRHAELIGELEGLLVETPAREHLAAQLMLALYRSGRQADALDVYQRVRAALAGELGLEPGPALKALQIEILEQAASLWLRRPDAGRPHRAAIGVPVGPSADARRACVPMARRCSPGAAGSARRSSRALSEVVDSGRRAAFVTGEPGIGKTRLVSEFARDAHADGTLVLAGRCDDDLSLPYQPFVEALEHLVAHAPAELLERHIAEYGESIARLVPALSAHAPDAPAVARAERVRALRPVSGDRGPAGGGCLRGARAARARGSALGGPAHAEAAQAVAHLAPQLGADAAVHLPRRRTRGGPPVAGAARRPAS